MAVSCDKASHACRVGDGSGFRGWQSHRISGLGVEKRVEAKGYNSVFSKLKQHDNNTQSRWREWLWWRFQSSWASGCDGFKVVVFSGGGGVIVVRGCDYGCDVTDTRRGSGVSMV